MRGLRGVRYTVEPRRSRRKSGGALEIDEVIANGKSVGTIEYFRKGGHVKVRTCSRRLKVCKRGRDLVWLLEAANLMGARRR